MTLTLLALALALALLAAQRWWLPELRLDEHVQGVGAAAVRDVVIDQFVLRRI